MKELPHPGIGVLNTRSAHVGYFLLPIYIIVNVVSF
jgi:hypothetical protein